jgi:hypothetical protein
MTSVRTQDHSGGVVLAQENGLERLLTIADVEDLTSKSETFWRRQVARGALPVVRIGRGVRVKVSDLQRFLYAPPVSTYPALRQGATKKGTPTPPLSF